MVRETASTSEALGKLPGLSICIPAFNEAEALVHTLPEIARAAERFAESSQIVLVDDGSGDGTADVAAPSGSDLTVLRHARRRGVGAALRTAFAAADQPFVFFISADGQFDPDDLERLIPLLEKADVIVGYPERRVESGVRLAVSRLYHLGIALLFGLRMRNINSIKLLRREVADRIDLRAEGPLLDAELLIRARAAGFRLAEHPVRHYPRRAGTPGGASRRAIAHTARELLIIGPELWKLSHRRPSS